MAALTQDRNTVYREGAELPYKVAASTKVYAGAGVCTNASGYLIPAADTAGIYPAGVSQEQKDNSSGANGDLTARVRRTGVHRMKGSGFTIADLGKVVYWSDDQTVALTTTNSIKAGIIAEFISATEVGVDISMVN